ncbi:hypothetical protein DFH09DRAFT_1374658 [Mycena vulgaris]|nr:hypothetical protein DFH09DRAFT_1374658 [Mycena vulgaris]
MSSGPVDWDLRIRYCARCTKRRITLFDDENPPNLVADGSVRLRNLISARPPSLKCGYLTHEFAAMQKYLGILDVTSRAGFFKDRQAVYARKCREWELKVAGQKVLADATIRTSREQVIRSKLFSLGWADVLGQMGPTSELAAHPLVTKTEVLTDETLKVHSLDGDDWAPRLRLHPRSCGPVGYLNGEPLARRRL